MMRLWSRVSRLWVKDSRPLGAKLSDVAQRGARVTREVAAGAVFLRNCDQVGKRARVAGGRPRIDNQGYIAIGSRTVLICQMGPSTLRTGPGGRLVIGDSVMMNFGTLISANQSVRIGDRVSIGQYCLIADTEGADDAPNAESAPIEIGDGAWLAARVTVLPGVRIGAGSVITAGSIVSTEIPAGVVAGGIPARVLRKLLPGESGPESARPIVPSTVPAPSERLPLSQPSRRGLIVSDFTANELERRLTEDLQLPRVTFECAAFGQVIPSLISAAPESCDVLVVWTRPEAVISGFRRLTQNDAVDEPEIIQEVDEFCDLILKAAAGYKTVLIATWVVPTYQRGLGVIDARKGGAYRTLTAMNLRLMTRLEAATGVFVLNAQRWIETAGRGAHQPKLWYMGKVPFHSDVFAEAARDIKTAISAVSGNSRKLLVLDLDDTVWGGIVGDAGWENLRLGGHDSVGEAFVDFQHAVKDLKRRGILLAIASKNEEAVALEAIRCHPEMVLSEEDFVGRRINWQDKARNIADLALELNVGLQSVVFIDDNPVERDRVREELPEVLVPEWPEDKLLYASTLRALRCFDTTGLSEEDRDRSQLYRAERQRETLRVEVGSVEDWLKGLNIEVHVARLGPANILRTTQLMNKTNQLNLSTKRYTEAELSRWAKSPDHDFWSVSVSDRFGDAGLTGIVSLEYEHDIARISDFVLSCRVMGRKVEETLLHIALTGARKRGARRIQARYVPTKKNKPCLEFLQRSGLIGQGEEFFWDTAQDYRCPDVVSLHFEDVDASS